MEKDLAQTVRRRNAVMFQRAIDFELPDQGRLTYNFPYETRE
jgi:hypothetical protein